MNIENMTSKNYIMELNECNEHIDNISYKLITINCQNEHEITQAKQNELYEIYKKLLETRVKIYHNLYNDLYHNNVTNKNNVVKINNLNISQPEIQKHYEELERYLKDKNNNHFDDEFITRVEATREIIGQIIGLI